MMNRRCDKRLDCQLRPVGCSTCTKPVTKDVQRKTAILSSLHTFALLRKSS